MYCIKCGSENSDEAVYCKKCGHLQDAEEETRIAQLPKNEANADDDEEEIFSINPTLLFVKIGYGLAVLGAFLLVILLNLLGGLAGIAIPYFISIPAGLSLLLIPAYFHLKQKMLRYTLTDSKFELDHGLISKTTRNVPLRIIQDVTVSATFTQRLLGFGNIEIENANESDDKIILKNINSPKKYAEIVLKQMRKLDK
jgi:uncharacterized membrane protein YdbT with pleckstrin-like domain